ncbi:MAG: hypothetical protein MR767_07555 [Christensenellaceae bacterium]|nr:hypothetical protein [Christensenellaceae bacterium]
MKKRVYDYICSHPDTSIHDIASAIDKPEIDVLNIENTLDREGYITLSRMVPLSPENFDSCRYSATGKQYSGD